MSRIASLHALEILDSRGNPTIEVSLKTTDGTIGKTTIPSGASTGAAEAVELRDGDPKRYFGKGVQKAVANVLGPLQKAVIGLDVCDQKKIDETLIKTDGSPNKHIMGANAILGVSLAAAKAAAKTKHEPLYQSLEPKNEPKLPRPLINVINGGVHADSGLPFQEFMICPHKFPTFKEALRAGVEVFHTLRRLLKAEGYTVSVGDEGGFAPKLKSQEEAFDWILKAIEEAGYTPKEEISIALDCAASEFYDSKTKGYLGKTAAEYASYLLDICKRYSLSAIEDPFDQDDWATWSQFTQKAPCPVIGDDIFVTNCSRIERGIREKTASSVLIKLNQIGTVTETLDAIRLAHQANLSTVISHRSGETGDTTIADLAVGARSWRIKTGSLCRYERIAKYNRLLEIEEEITRSK